MKKTKNYVFLKNNNASLTICANVFADVAVFTRMDTSTKPTIKQRTTAFNSLEKLQYFT